MENANKVKLDSAIWDPSCLNILRKSTRKHKFNFDMVASEMQQFFQDNNNPNIIVTSELCRRIFAGDYYSEAVPVEARPIEKSTVPSINDKDLSFHQILDIIHANEDENFAKQEKVFSRVLSTLLGADSNIITSSMKTQVTHENAMLFARVEEQKLLREARRQKLEQAQREHEERKELEQQRENLRLRFEDKLQADEYESNDHSHEITNISSPTPSTKSNENDFSFTSEHISVYNVNMKDVFESKEFDMILDELESDITNTLSPGKGIEGIPISSELQEMFQLLDDESNIIRNIDYDTIPSYPIPAISLHVHAGKPSNDDKPSSNQPLPPSQELINPPISHAQQPSVDPKPPKTSQPRNIANASDIPMYSRGIKESRYKDFSSNIASLDRATISDDEDEDDADENWRKMRTSAKKSATCL